MIKPKTCLNLGWGVQSFTMAAMVALGDMPKPDVILHADTTYEREGTYQFAKWGVKWLSEMGLEVLTLKPPPDKPNNIQDAPWFTGDGGMLRRQCTHKWKIRPIDKYLRAQGGVWEKWIGISLDEWQRMKTPRGKWYTMVYPLVDRRMTRADCAAYLKKHGLPIPPKSSCAFCPYHSRGGWGEVKKNSTDWELTTSVDEQIRSISPHGAFVHVSRIPVVDAVKIPQDFGYEQLELCDAEGGCFL